ncbi:glycosyltransferase family 39 protein [Sphingomonas lycopersici]|uniref:Polyprenol-phosphate-mannose--protein mannosyltransferase n=1 Tax=Sphingomonas lycopersici TaxID=2951807 RepID=A0AA42CW47_9SPHN|nr:glycosyltransferase family 39 protein [Sphingomonas lycopersici]MCW6537411.1 glycosyltransferase family 39 protein [Sphingomonas lycopersici]
MKQTGKATRGTAINAWLPRTPLPVAILLGAVAEALFLVRVAVPHRPIFDEIYYVPAARAMLERAYLLNREHPPLAKELIALGIRLFGDTPVGWRFMSTLAGTATVLAVFAIVQLMTGRLRSALFAGVLTILNFTVLVQARIAMLDTFMTAFLLAGIATIAWAMRDGGWGKWLAGAMLLGAATACKWAAAPYVAFAAFAFLLLKRGHPQRWPGLAPLPAVALLGLVSVATYFLSFAPVLHFRVDPLTWRGLPSYQYYMYEQQVQVLPHHTYQSDWWTWPLLIRPIWYLYEVTDGAQRGILMIGNPLLMWGGLVAVAACLWGWMTSRSARLLAAFALWAGSVATFALIPKSLGFYYYYYPSSIFIVIAIAAVFDHWRARLGKWDERLVIAAFILALCYFPVLSAQALGSPRAFQYWTWLPSWV